MQALPSALSLSVCPSVCPYACGCSPSLAASPVQGLWRMLPQVHMPSRLERCITIATREEGVRSGLATPSWPRLGAPGSEGHSLTQASSKSGAGQGENPLASAQKRA